MNRPMKVMIGHTQGQKAIKNRNWTGTQLSWLLFWYSPCSLVNKDLPFTSYRKMLGRRKTTNTPNPILEEIQSSL